MLITGSWDRTLKYWDLRQPSAAFTHTLPDRLYAMSAHPPPTAPAAAAVWRFVSRNDGGFHAGGVFFPGRRLRVPAAGGGHGGAAPAGVQPGKPADGVQVAAQPAQVPDALRGRVPGQERLPGRLDRGARRGAPRGGGERGEELHVQVPPRRRGHLQRQRDGVPPTARHARHVRVRARTRCSSELAPPPLYARVLASRVVRRAVAGRTAA